MVLEDNFPTGSTNKENKHTTSLHFGVDAVGSSSATLCQPGSLSGDVLTKCNPHAHLRLAEHGCWRMSEQAKVLYTQRGLQQPSHARLCESFKRHTDRCHLAGTSETTSIQVHFSFSEISRAAVQVHGLGDMDGPSGHI